ncbi:hypothetical protein [Actinomadura decatromicini]|uniref:Uncharacterized protein n=1 Tax=Actinomadura decatromicini TaxID=2604572 RepID=A0A5D3F634_9ACTN|nr:hypothetical protein [Actinomadura decatromicini]TYK43633.1 hypothetical protein FXF68_36375 [Actinomadura decatromicini]
MDQLEDALGFDPEKLAKDADTFFNRLRDMHQADAEITARAESADRRVAVEYSSAEGVRTLHIDPRAMRTGADEPTQQRPSTNSKASCAAEPSKPAERRRYQIPALRWPLPSVRTIRLPSTQASEHGAALRILCELVRRVCLREPG